MKRQWVYIYSDADEQLFIGTTEDAGMLLSDLQDRAKELLYLCPFKQVFNALAQKSLLERLTKPTILSFVAKNKEKTRLWISQLKDLYL